MRAFVLLPLLAIGLLYAVQLREEVQSSFWRTMDGSMRSRLVMRRGGSAGAPLLTFGLPPAPPLPTGPGPLARAAAAATHTLPLPHCHRSNASSNSLQAVIVSAYFDVPTLKRTR